MRILNKVQKLKRKFIRCSNHLNVSAERHLPNVGGNAALYLCQVKMLGSQHTHTCTAANLVISKQPGKQTQ